MQRPACREISESAPPWRAACRLVVELVEAAAGHLDPLRQLPRPRLVAVGASQQGCRCPTKPRRACTRRPTSSGAADLRRKIVVLMASASETQLGSSSSGIEGGQTANPLDLAAGLLVVPRKGLVQPLGLPAAAEEDLGPSPRRPGSGARAFFQWRKSSTWAAPPGMTRPAEVASNSTAVPRGGQIRRKPSSSSMARKPGGRVAPIRHQSTSPPPGRRRICADAALSNRPRTYTHVRQTILPETGCRATLRRTSRSGMRRAMLGEWRAL